MAPLDLHAGCRERNNIEELPTATMTMLTRITRRTSDALLLSVIGAQHALAADLGEIPDSGGTTTDLPGAIESIIQFILFLLGSIAVLVIVIAGVRLVIGGGDEGERTKARDAVLYAVVGLVVVLLASAIVNFVADKL